MTVASILAQKGGDVITAQTDDTVMDIINLLAEKKIGATVVLTATGDVCGIVSERDIVRDIARHGTDILGGPVSDCMTKKVISCKASDTVNSAMEIMNKNRFRHLPVIEDGKLVGLVSIGDVVKKKIEQAEKEAEDIRSYIAAS